MVKEQYQIQPNYITNTTQAWHQSYSHCVWSVSQNFFSPVLHLAKYMGNKWDCKRHRQSSCSKGTKWSYQHRYWRVAWRWRRILQSRSQASNYMSWRQSWPFWYPLLETETLPSAKFFAECQKSGTRQRRALGKGLLCRVPNSRQKRGTRHRLPRVTVFGHGLFCRVPTVRHSAKIYFF